MSRLTTQCSIGRAFRFGHTPGVPHLADEVVKRACEFARGAHRSDPRMSMDALMTQHVSVQMSCMQLFACSPEKVQAAEALENLATSTEAIADALKSGVGVTLDGDLGVSVGGELDSTVRTDGRVDVEVYQGVSEVFGVSAQVHAVE